MKTHFVIVLLGIKIIKFSENKKNFVPIEVPNLQNNIAIWIGITFDILTKITNENKTKTHIE